MSADPLPRPDWRDSIALAADLALLGILLTIACLPVVTAGGALVTASVAVDQAGSHRSFPAVRELGRTFRLSLVPGFVAIAVTLVAAAVVVLDALALVSGRVPGGVAALVGTALVAGAGFGIAAAALVRLGQTGGRGYRAALRFATRLIWRRPLVGVGILATVAVPVLLATVLPVAAPLLPGFVLFGLHAVIRRCRA